VAARARFAALFAALFDIGSLASVSGRFGATATATVRGGSVEAATACNITFALDGAFMASCLRARFKKVVGRT
jgi:hypothetical protein